MSAERYSFQFKGDVDSCTALSDLLRAGWELSEDGFTVREGFHWINLERYGTRPITYVVPPIARRPDSLRLRFERRIIGAEPVIVRCELSTRTLLELMSECGYPLPPPPARFPEPIVFRGVPMRVNDAIPYGDFHFFNNC